VLQISLLNDSFSGEDAGSYGVMSLAGISVAKKSVELMEFA